MNFSVLSGYVYREGCLGLFVYPSQVKEAMNYGQCSTPHTGKRESQVGFVKEFEWSRFIHVMGAITISSHAGGDQIYEVIHRCASSHSHSLSPS